VRRFETELLSTVSREDDALATARKVFSYVNDSGFWEDLSKCALIILFLY
jgi:hypothetical protein